MLPDKHTVQLLFIFMSLYILQYLFYNSNAVSIFFFAPIREYTFTATLTTAIVCWDPERGALEQKTQLAQMPAAYFSK